MHVSRTMAGRYRPFCASSVNERRRDQYDVYVADRLVIVQTWLLSRTKQEYKRALGRAHTSDTRHVSLPARSTCANHNPNSNLTFQTLIVSSFVHIYLLYISKISRKSTRKMFLVFMFRDRQKSTCI